MLATIIFTMVWLIYMILASVTIVYRGKARRIAFGMESVMVYLVILTDDVAAKIVVAVLYQAVIVFVLLAGAYQNLSLKKPVGPGTELVLYQFKSKEDKRLVITAERAKKMSTTMTLLATIVMTGLLLIRFTLIPAIFSHAFGVFYATLVSIAFYAVASFSSAEGTDDAEKSDIDDSLLGTIAVLCLLGAFALAFLFSFAWVVFDLSDHWSDTVYEDEEAVLYELRPLKECAYFDPEEYSRYDESLEQYILTEQNLYDGTRYLRFFAKNSAELMHLEESLCHIYYDENVSTPYITVKSSYKMTNRTKEKFDEVNTYSIHLNGAAQLLDEERLYVSY